VNMMKGKKRRTPKLDDVDTIMEMKIL
jgi:hypothetical protein